MASRFVNPFPQFMDATPTMRAGAKLFFYAAGTSTKINTYSDKALTSPNTNPVVLNSAGYTSTDVYLQDLDYKVVLAPSTDTDPPTSPIWSADYVRGRDSALIAKTLTGSGSPNGVVAGTAGSSSILPDFYWDYTNSILYVCTATGTTSTAIWTAVNSSSATPSVPQPQGRLTPSSGSPVITSDVVSAASVYYEPYSGNLVPIYNGSAMIPTAFAALPLSLASQHVASTLYDLFVFSNAGVLTLVSGPAWSVSTAGSCARGVGASSTQLTRVSGLWVNAVAMTARNGAATYSVGANLGTYVGSMFIDGSAGQVTCHVAFGQSRRWGVWNAYNRIPIVLRMGDPTSSWTSAPTSWRQSRADSTNFVHIFSGLPEEIHDLAFTQYRQLTVNGSDATNDIGIGYNSTTVVSGTQGRIFASKGSATLSDVHSGMSVALYAAPPVLGINKINAIEQATSGTTANSFFGTEPLMCLTAKWRG